MKRLVQVRSLGENWRWEGDAELSGNGKAPTGVAGAIILMLDLLLGAKQDGWRSRMMSLSRSKD